MGTINAFSSIDLIDFCIEEAEENNNFKFYIDFRYDDSIHWKLYMIKPDIIVIGSVNFTQKGLKFIQDMCLYIKNKELYLDYLKESAEVKALDKVFDCKNENFNNELKNIEKTFKIQNLVKFKLYRFKFGRLFKKRNST
ncbi:MAG: hypothetical protein J6570_05455 [Snodgrassella sp.]|nr:hypothetical protein [Snodgrassella sp.]